MNKTNTRFLFRFLSIWTLAAINLTPCVAADPNPDPFNGRATLFHADLARYFTDSAAEIEARKLLKLTTEKFLRSAPWAVEETYQHLETGGQLISAWMRHRVYCRARNARDMTDKPAKLCETEADDQSEIVIDYVNTQLQRPAIQQLSEADINRYHLSRYRFLIQQSKDAVAHILPAGEIKIIDQLIFPEIDRLASRYDYIVRNLNAMPIGKLDPIKDAKIISHDADPAIRRSGYEARMDAIMQHGEVIAASLIDIAQLENALARLHGYPSAPVSMYADRLQLSEQQVRDTIESVTQHADVLKDYSKLRIHQISRLTGLSDVHSWDMELSSGFTPVPRSFEQSKMTVLNALAPLGTEYVAEFDWLLNPQNGALEIAGGPNRARGGFSLGYSGVPVLLYIDNFDGSVTKTSTLIHEGGHAIHRKLMGDAPAYFAVGPKFLFEAYAIFNQLLLWEEFEKQSNTIAEKVYFQERFLDTLAKEVFTSAEEAAFEQGLYDGVASGSIRGVDDLNSLNGKILDQFEVLAPREPRMRSNWMEKGLLFDDPLYLVNYMYAALVACKLYQMDKANPAEFQQRYMALLREGFDASAARLLKKNMGISLDNNELLEAALQLMRERTEQLRRTYEITKVNQ